MADYAEWGEAVSRSLGWGAETFLSAYDDNRKGATDPLLEGSPVATLLFALAKQRVNWSWSGTTQKLYEKVTTAAEGHLGPAWPKTFSLFGTELRRIAPQLRLHGIAINFERKRTGTIVTLSVENGKTVGPQPDTAVG